MAYTNPTPAALANDGSTGAQTLTNLSTGSYSSAVLEGLLKDVYLPALNDTVFNDPSLYMLFEKNSSPLQFQGQRIIKGFKTQKAGGVGAITEGGSWTTSVPAKGQQGYEMLRFMNAYFEITNPALESAKQGVGSFINEAEESLRDMMDNAKIDLDWQLGNKKDGILASFTGTAADISNTTGTTYTLSGGDGFFYGQFLRVGMNVDIFADSSGLTTGSKLNTSQTVTVIDVDSAASTPTATLLADASGVTLEASTTYHITPVGQKSSDGLRINSLYDLVNNTGSVWSLDRSTHTYLKGYVYDPGTSVQLDEELLMRFLTVLKYQYQAKPNLMICSPNDMLTYFSNITGERQFNTTGAIEWTGGVKGMGVTVGDQTLMLTVLGSLTQGDLFAINSNDFRFATQTNGYRWVDGNGSILHQKESSDVKYATAVNYMNFICDDPKRQGRITDLAEDFPNLTTS